MGHTSKYAGDFFLPILKVIDVKGNWLQDPISVFFKRWYHDKSVLDMKYIKEVCTPLFQEQPLGVDPQHLRTTTRGWPMTLKNKHLVIVIIFTRTFT